MDADANSGYDQQHIFECAKVNEKISHQQINHVEIAIVSYGTRCEHLCYPDRYDIFAAIMVITGMPE